MAEQISMAHDDLAAFARGGPAIEAPVDITDRMHALLVTRADELMSCPRGSPEEVELETLAHAIEAYEAVRWPEGRIPGGKG